MKDNNLSNSQLLKENTLETDGSQKLSYASIATTGNLGSKSFPSFSRTNSNALSQQHQQKSQIQPQVNASKSTKKSSTASNTTGEWQRNAKVDSRGQSASLGRESTPVNRTNNNFNVNTSSAIPSFVNTTSSFHSNNSPSSGGPKLTAKNSVNNQTVNNSVGSQRHAAINAPDLRSKSANSSNNSSHGQLSGVRGVATHETNGAHADRTAVATKASVRDKHPLLVTDIKLVKSEVKTNIDGGVGSQSGLEGTASRDQQSHGEKVRDGHAVSLEAQPSQVTHQIHHQSQPQQKLSVTSANNTHDTHDSQPDHHLESCKSIASCVTSNKCNCILHFTFKADVCIAANDRFFVRIAGSKSLQPLTKYAENHFWASVELLDSFVKTVRYETLYLHKRQKDGLFAAVGTFLGAASHENVEVKLFAGTATLPSRRADFNFKGMVFCLSFDIPAEMQMLKFLAYVCGQQDVELHVPLRDFVMLFSGPQNRVLFVNNGYLEKMRALLTPQQASQFPLIASVCVGALHKANNTLNGCVLSNAPAFPSADILRCVSSAQVACLKDPTLLEAAASGLNILIRHNLTYNLSDLAWLEKAANDEFLSDVVNNCKNLSESRSGAQQHQKWQLSRDAEDSFADIMSHFAFTGQKTVLLCWMFKISAESVSCKEFVLNCFFATARCFDTKRCFTPSASGQYQLLVKHLLLRDLILVAHVAKGHYPNTSNNESVIAPLKTALIDHVARSTLAEVQSMTVDDCNAMFLDEKWLTACFEHVMHVAPTAIDRVFDSALIVFLGIPQNLPVLALKWVDSLLIAKRQRDEKLDVLITTKTVLEARVLMQCGLRWLKVTAPAQVAALETQVMDAIRPLLARITAMPWDCIQCVTGIADMIRPVSAEVAPFSNHVVAWLRDKIEALLLQLAGESNGLMRVLKEIDCRSAQSCDFSVAVMVTFLDLMSNKLPANLKYADVAPFSTFVQMLSALSDMVSCAQIERHAKFGQIRVLMTKLLVSIASEDITVEQLLELKTVAIGGGDWKSPLVEFASAYEHSVVRDTIVRSEEIVVTFQTKLQTVRLYLVHVQLESKEGEEGFVVDALAELNRLCAHLEDNIGSLTVRQLRGQDVWGRLYEIVHLAEEFTSCKGSKLFESVWRRELATRVSCELGNTDLGSDAERRASVRQLVVLCEEVADATGKCMDSFLLSFSNPATLKIGAVAQIWVSGLVFNSEQAALGLTIYNEKLVHFRNEWHLLQALTEMYAFRGFATGLLAVFEMFEGVDGSASCGIIDVTTALSNFDVEAEDASLLHVYEHMMAWQDAVTQLTSGHFDRFVDLLRELQLCGEVVSFLQLLRDEKNVNLIDMVEDSSDSIVRAETVAEFDSIRRSFRGLLLLLVDKGNCNPEAFMYDLTQFLLTGDDVDKHLTAKLFSCRSQIHSIRDIWFSVAKREESTKKLCRKINASGEAIWCRTETSEFVLAVTCLNADGVLEYKDQVSVEELRSRALLLVNTAHQAFGAAEDETAAASDKEQLRTFIDIVAPAMQVTQTLSALIRLGHFDYQKPLIKAKFGADELAELLRSIQGHKNVWELQLRALRSEQYFSNYYFSTQFWHLHKFFSSNSMHVAEAERREAIEVLSKLELMDDSVKVEGFFAVSNADSAAADCKKAVALLQYVDGSRSEADYVVFETCYESELFKDLLLAGVDVDVDGSNSVSFLKVLGEALGRIYCNSIVDADKNNISASEEPVSFLKYRDNAGLIPLLFGVYPVSFERNQLLICESNTSHEEMSMFLMRVYSGGHDVSTVGTIYTVINLHKLSHNDRASFMRLMTAVKNHHPQNPNSLVLLLRDDVSGCVDGMKLPVTAGITPRQEIDIRALVEARAPRVGVVRSAAAGMGKTEHCAIEAMKFGQLLHTVLVTDGMSRRDLVLQIQDMALGSHHCLHLDVCNLTHESDIAIGLLELLFLGTSQIDTTVVHWDVGSLCFVERANKVSLQYSVEVDALRYFPTKALTWSPVTAMVKFDLDSDMQVVCNYLLLLDADTVATTELLFPGMSDQRDSSVPAVVVSAAKCRQLLNKYFTAGLTQNETPSANVLMVFLHVLAVQLRRFSSSGQFVVEYMTEAKVRTAVVANMVACSRDFATRSVVHARNRQRQHEARGGDEDYDECEGLLRWEDNEQTMVCILSYSLALLYKRLSSVDEKLVMWYNIQAHKKEDQLTDYYGMTSDELRARLSNFCGLLETYKARPDYVLTPDNFLKCVMILLRVQADVPVIIMGEAGCGKTSLVRFIGEMYNASICVLPIHAGVDRAAITKQIGAWIRGHSAQNKALGKVRPLWLFLDEINTCSELGFINSVVCHRQLPGVRIPKFVSFFAACNPFKRRALGTVKKVGLSTKTLTGGASKGDGLVYRVKPLPETMLDYIWDFGSLSAADEKLYIAKFIGQLAKQYSSEIKPAIAVLIDLIAMSQCFIRHHFTAGTVSMRDVRRVKLLFVWFMEHKLPFSTGRFEYNYELRKAHRCIVLALTQCYRCRLSTTDLRDLYDESVSHCFVVAGVFSMTEPQIQIVIRDEQEGYLREMTVPEGIARNSSLVENVFVLLVCILNKIPVFIVGKPGSSKSLSIVLINSNMRGKDSDSAFFRSLPEVKIICFQGSESSTSEGILKIFRKAEGFVTASNADGSDQKNNVIPVVLIDEIGLAEISPFNPLKVLHRQLETEDDRPLDIAVVGISNWELDLSKMSRAVYLARPEPDVTELANTAMTIMDTIYGSRIRHLQVKMHDLSESYIAFCTHQELSGHANFHGLRDFYSTCKFLGHELKKNNIMTSADVTYALLRNFGGLSLQLKETAFKKFFEQAENDESRQVVVPNTSVAALVADNLRDKNARHLMLISEGDSIMSVISDLFEAAGVTKYRVIIGSKFRGDKSENYRYRMLSEIILCMERGESLALRDMDDIYQSLYDMLNQNYTVVAGKKNCRIALGAFSNPVAHVHDNFKCIVMPDAKKVYTLDPPFLNRFEKHVIDFRHVLLPIHHKLVKHLAAWVEFMCQAQSSGEDNGDQFTDRDIFVGFSSTGTLSSLVLSVISKNSTATESEVLLICKEKLVCMATFQGMVRALSSQQASFSGEETRRLFDSYVADKRHISLRYFVEQTVDTECLTSKSIVSTYSNFFFADVKDHTPLAPEALAYIKLSAFDTELDLLNFVSDYFVSAEQSMLILQCDVAVDADKLLMTKSIIDKEMREYKELCDAAMGTGNKAQHCCKHVVLLLHTKSELYEDDRLSGRELYFSADWDDFHIDNLEQDDLAWRSVRTVIAERQTLAQYLNEHEEVIESCFDDLMSCFRHIKYLKNDSGGDTQQRIKDLRASSALQMLLRDKITRALETDPRCHTDGWLLRVATARENLEFSSSSLAVAVTSYAVSVVRGYLSQCVYLFEKYSAFEPYLHRALLPEYERNIFLYAGELDLARVSAASGPDCYEVSSVCEDLECAFSALLERRIDEVKFAYLEASQSGSLDDRILENFMAEIATVIETFGRETNTTGLFNQRLYCGDAVRLFIRSTSSDGVMPYAVVEHVVNSLLELLECTVTTADILYLLLWRRSRLIVSMVSLMQSDESEHSTLQVANAHRIQDLCELFEAAPSTSTEEVVVFALFKDFCDQHWIILKEQPFAMANLTQWCDVVQRKLPHLVSVCQEVGFKFQFGFLSDDASAEFSVFNVQLMPYYLHLQVTTDLCKLLEKSFGDDIPHDRGDLMQLLTSYFVDSPSAMNSKWLDQLMQFVDMLSGELPDKTRGLLAAFKYKTLKRFMLLPVVDLDSSDMAALLSSTVYVQVGKCLTLDAVSPPLVCRELVSILVEKLCGAFFDISDHEAVAAREQCLFGTLCDFDAVVSLAGMTASINAFESLFCIVGDGDEDVAAASGTQLETMMTDMMCEYLSQTEGLEFDDDEACTVFAAVVTRWESGFDSLGLVERMIGVAFCRLFLDTLAAQLDSDVALNDALNQTMQNTLGADRPHSLFHVCRIYVLKALRLPQQELKLACVDGGWLHAKARWVDKYAWQPAVLVSHLLPVRVKAHDAEVKTAWDGLFHPYSPSGDGMTALLDSVSAGDSSVLTGLISIAFAAKCRTATPNDSAVDISSILSAWPATADARQKVLFQVVHSRFTTPCALPASNFDLDDVCLLNVVVSLMNVDSPQFADSVFGSYMRDAQVVRSTFVLGAHSSDLAAVMRAHGDGVGYYRCPCGYVYEIENCKLPGGYEATCKCGRMLGGHNHLFTEAGTKPVELDTEDLRGYNFPVEYQDATDYTVRGLTRNESRILSLLVHCCALIGLYTSPAEFAVALNEGADKSNEAVRKCWAWVKANWIVLCGSMAIDGDRKELLCALLMQLVQNIFTNPVPPLAVVLQTAAMRDEAEVAFAGLCAPLLDSFAVASLAALNEWREPASETVFEREIQERDNPAVFMPKCFRLLRAASSDDVRNLYLSSAATMLMYPIMGIYFQFEADLHRIRDILPLMRWPMSVRKCLNFVFEITDVAVTAADTLEKDSRLSVAEYNEFEAAWNKFAEVSPTVNNDKYFDALTIVDCHAVILRPLSAADSILYSCARSCARLTLTGREAPYMCHTLGEIQNKFLAAVFATRSQYKRADDVATRKFLHDVTETDVITHDGSEIWKALMRFVRADLNYGMGMQLECDWELMEAALMARLVDGKALLCTRLSEEGALQSYRYKQELFQDQADLFARVHELVPQTSALPDAEAIRGDHALCDVGVVDTKLFPALNNLIFMLLKQRKGTLCTEQTLLEFANAYLDNDAHWQQMNTRNSAVVSLKLEHVEALYEVMEDAISTTVIGCLHAKFRDDINIQLLTDIYLYVIPLAGDIVTLESIVRRFIMRYLRNADAKNPTDAVFHYLSQMRWPDSVGDIAVRVESDQNLERIFNRLCLGQLGTLQQALQQRIDEVREFKHREQARLQQDQQAALNINLGGGAYDARDVQVVAEPNGQQAVVKKTKKPLVRPKGNTHAM